MPFYILHSIIFHCAQFFFRIDPTAWYYYFFVRNINVVTKRKHLLLVCQVMKLTWLADSISTSHVCLWRWIPRGISLSLSLFCRCIVQYDWGYVQFVQSNEPCACCLVIHMYQTSGRGRHACIYSIKASLYQTWKSQMHERHGPSLVNWITFWYSHCLLTYIQCKS